MEAHQIKEGLDKLPDIIADLNRKYEYAKSEHDLFYAKKLVITSECNPKKSATIVKAMITEECEPFRLKMVLAEIDLNRARDLFITVRKSAELIKIEYQSLGDSV